MTFIEDEWWEPSPEQIRRAYTCEGCGQYNKPGLMLNEPCPTGDCTLTVCPRCRHRWASVGPVLCKSCGGLTWLQRQHHRISMWVFDRIELPLRVRWRKWRKR